MRFFITFILLSLYAMPINAQGDCNCCKPEYRQFDFWVGQWETFNPNGKLLGTNTIDIVQNSCILRENWKSASGTYPGTSYNFYDRDLKLWTQTWVDNQGGSLIMKGKYGNNKMILTSEPTKNESGKHVINKITWTNNTDGTVRQLWESKTGKDDWVVAFDGLYKKAGVD